MSRRYRVIPTRTAARQVRTAHDWWRRNRRDAPGILAEELLEAFNLVSTHPMIGAVADNVGLPDVRRHYLTRSRYHLYYQIDHADRVVFLVALWHGSRGSGPTL
jgi:plasmid stabilization system protein ParE